MFRKSRSSQFILMCLAIVFLLAGSIAPHATARDLTPTPSPIPTVFYANGGPFFTWPLMCPKDIPLREGLSWRGIIVGKSRLDDLEELYGVRAARVVPEPQIFPGSFADIYEIVLTPKASIERKLAMSFEACVVNWKIAALAIHIINDSEFSDSLEMWVLRFGAPEIISWPTGGWESWRYRTLLWPKKGLALYIDLGDFSGIKSQVFVTTVIFLPPVHDDGDLARWPYSQLQKTPVTNMRGEDPGPLNPFDFPAMIATAQPSRTPTPTFTPAPTQTSFSDTISSEDSNAVRSTLIQNECVPSQSTEECTLCRLLT